MVKMKVKMEVQVEDDKGYFNNVHKAPHCKEQMVIR